MQNMFILTNFLDTLLLKNGYTFLNTFIYTVLVLLGFLFFYNFFKKKTINFFFIRSFIPFLLLGATLRIFEQERYITCTFTNFFFKVPGLLIFLFLFYFSCYLLATTFYKKRYHKYLETFGYSFLSPFLVFVFLNISNVYWLFILLIIFVTCYIIFNIFKKTFSKKINKLTFFAQTLDATATTFGVWFLSNHLQEVHILSSFFVSIHPLLFFLFKIFLTTSLIFLIDKQVKQQQVNTYLKSIIIIHGLLIGFRTFLTIFLL